MTSALNFDITGYGNAPVAPSKSSEKGSSEDFMQMVNDAVSDSKGGNDILADHLSRQKEAGRGTDSIDLVNTKPKTFDTKERVMNLSKPGLQNQKDAVGSSSCESKPVDQETKDTVKDELEKFGNEVRQTIKNDQEVTDEEITEAMEALGFTYADLLNPDNVKSLIAELSGEDAISLLTDENFPNLLSSIEELGAGLIETTGMEPADIKGIEIDMMLSGELSEDGIELPPMAVLPAEGIELPPTAVLPAKGETAEGETSETGTVNMQTDIPVSQDEPVTEDIPEAVKTTPEAVTEALPEDDLAYEDKPVVQKAVPEAQAEVTVDTEEAEAEAPLVQKNPVTNESEADETNDIADAPEEGVNNLVQKTGQSGNAEEGDNTENAAEEMLNRSRDNMARVSQSSVTAAENTSVQTFTQTVINEAGQQAVEIVQSYTSIDTREVISQIVTQARTTISETVTQMEMMLNPENLGRMILQVTQQEGMITARFIAQSEGVKEALQMQMELLRESLNNAGVKIDAVEVSTGTHEFERNLDEGMSGSANEQSESGREGEGRQSRRNINFNDPDQLGGVMSEEEALVASMMRDQGNTMNVTA
ncbi:MAG: flagellar hook-length control protein FliK [Lachnospiraceae bacterium]|nr:flagellar hook-length control protein FliK [Lachnospiraceae bacterium]